MNGPGADGLDYTWCSVFSAILRWSSNLHLAMSCPTHSSPGQDREWEQEQLAGIRGISSGRSLFWAPTLLAEAEVVQTDCTVTQGQGCLATCLPQCQPAQPGESESWDWWCFSQYFVISMAFHMFYILNQGSAATQRSFFIFRNIFSLKKSLPGTLGQQSAGSREVYTI